MYGTEVLIWLGIAVLAVASGALVAAAAVAFDKRRRVPAVVPMCARCGYDLVGLDAAAACPECAAVGARAYRPIAECPKRREVLRMAWQWPVGGAVVVTGLLASAGGSAWQWGPLVATSAAVFAGLAGMLAVLCGWLTPRGGKVMVIGASVATTAALAGAVVAIVLGLASVPLSDVGTFGWLALPLASAGVVPGVVVSVREKW